MGQARDFFLSCSNLCMENVEKALSTRMLTMQATEHETYF